MNDSDELIREPSLSQMVWEKCPSFHRACQAGTAL